MTNTNEERKWLIPSFHPLTAQSLDDDKAIWDVIHEDYENRAASLTLERKLCEMLVSPSTVSPHFDIPNSPEVKVLIPGCGSEIYLQKTLLEACPQIGQVYCTDFSQVGIDKAIEKWKEADGESRLQNNQIVFERVDSTKFTEEKPDLQDTFDYVLLVNSVVSDDDEANRKMIDEFAKALKPGGKLYGFFQTTLCYVDIAVVKLVKTDNSQEKNLESGEDL
jgi:SAM-dependent methyltransferase